MCRCKNLFYFARASFFDRSKFPEEEGEKWFQRLFIWRILFQRQIFLHRLVIIWRTIPEHWTDLIIVIYGLTSFRDIKSKPATRYPKTARSTKKCTNTIMKMSIMSHTAPASFTNAHPTRTTFPSLFFHFVAGILSSKLNYYPIDQYTRQNPIHSTNQCTNYFLFLTIPLLTYRCKYREKELCITYYVYAQLWYVNVWEQKNKKGKK